MPCESLAFKGRSADEPCVACGHPLPEQQFCLFRSHFPLVGGELKMFTPCSVSSEGSQSSQTGSSKVI